ncbi:hypothetical protein LIER_11159 [Lithospermum erythrorhizon]|uniref:CW-type domain-containing protein n=1 Tax=Lithospermum erythrorhizon TaxID=34254 RepID=A0AAV3PNK0_LITER
MICERSGDGGIMIGVEKDMGIGDVELEEGEACYYQKGDAINIDPDVTLSYIDEKIEDILGHFQKDFEGGVVSAENLGPKFGGYGSFLPSQAPSPACSQQMTTSEVFDGNTPRSPIILDYEASQLSSLASCGSSLPLRLEAGSTSNSKGRESTNVRVKGDGRVSFNSVETPTSIGVEKSEFPYDQKTLKVRLKLGSNNLPVRKNDELYSGLGLDGSPSPSLNDHCTDSEGISHGIRDLSENSPTSILKIMTPFLLQGTQLLSPLSEELIRLTEKEKYSRESVSKPLNKEKVNGYNSRKDLHDPLPEKKTNSYVKGEFLEAGKHRNPGFSLKREIDTNDLTYEELVTNALKLPLLSDMQPDPRPAEGTVKSADLPRASNRGSSSIRPAVEQTLEHELAQERIQKSKGNILQKENLVTVAKKPTRHKGQRNIISTTVESGLSEQERVPSADLFNSWETKSMQADVSNNEVIGNQSEGEEQLCAMGTNNMEGDQSRDSLNNFASQKRNNGSHVNSPLPKSGSVNTNKGLKKITNKYEEFFGDLDFEQDDNEVTPNEVSSVKKLLNPKLEDNGSTLEDIRITKETSSVRKTGKPYKEEECSRASLNEKVSSTVARLKSDAISSVPAPELEDNWVLCDKCQKWRLLPLGRNPRSLPEKWMCNMLDWLPAMNRCTFSEEETSNAVRALYQVPGPLGTECKPPGHPGNSMSVVSSNGVSNSAHNGQMFDQQTSHTGAKKKYKSKYDSRRLVCDEPSQLSKSMMKNHQEKNKSLSSVNPSSLLDAYGNQYVGQCSSSLAEKHSNKPHKKNSLESSSVEVDAKNLKARKRRQSDSDSSRSSKKAKSQDVLYRDANCTFPPPAHIPREDKRTIDGHPKEVQDEVFNHIEATEITYDASLPNHKCDGKISSKKKRRQGEQGTRTYVGDLPQVGHQSQGRSEDTGIKVKKARTSNSEGKEATTKKSTCETDRKARKSIDQKIGKERGSSGTEKSLKRDLGSVHPSGASTSSSSKVSGSFKIRTNRQGVNGSPVESVSSSPLRVLGTDNSALTLRNPQEKDDRDRTFVKSSSPRGSLGVATNKFKDSRSVDSSVVDLQEMDLGFVSGAKIKVENRSSSNFANQSINENGSKGDQDTCKNQASDREQGEKEEDRTLNGGFHSRKLEIGMSLNHDNCIISENEKVHVTSPCSKNEALDDFPLSNGKFTGGKSRFQDSCNSFDNDEKNFISGRSSRVKDFRGINECENKPTPGGNDVLDDRPNIKESIVLNRDVQDSPNKLISDVRNGSEIFGNGRSHSLPPSARNKNDKGAHAPLIPGYPKENGVDITFGDAHGGASKALEQNKKGEKQNGSTPSRHSNGTMHKVRDHDGSSVRKDSRSQAATTAMKEAKDLKRLADRFKNSGSADSTGMYFEAALKFLYGASLLESGSRENNKHNDIQCIDMYRSTAKFCEFCAHEYERSKDMASASLAYKCMAVSYMRVIYTSHGNINRDRNEVQLALQIVPPGESPASSASDVDNLNNPITVDKVSASKGMTSPQVAGNTVITARNRSSLTRLLELAQDTNAAMEASRKSRATLAAANLRPGDANSGDGFSSVKRALDFNFEDVDGLLRLIRIAKDAISH